jgi:hypothetical protein
MTAAKVAERVGAHEPTMRSHANNNKQCVAPLSVTPESLAEYAAEMPTAILQCRTSHGITAWCDVV